MTSPDERERRSDDRAEFWKTIIVPTAKGLEGFLWRVAWFAVLIKLMLYS